MLGLAVSVEGRTEGFFVRRVLAPHLQGSKIYATPVLLGGDGGDVSLARVRGGLNDLAGSHDKVTTLYDFYGFRGKSSDETKDSLEGKIRDCVTESLRHRVLPYVQMYEFEGLLFADPEAIASTVVGTVAGDGLREWAQGVLDSFGGNPETINDSQQTAPSKRLLGKTDYNKVAHGPAIAEKIGLDILRQKCPGFGAWLAQLESLA